MVSKKKMLASSAGMMSEGSLGRRVKPDHGEI
jgi:hypothetical protein